MSLLAYPMHGQHKLETEGYRTRDGHLIEWFGRLTSGRGPVGVFSRPEPAASRLLRSLRARGAARAANTVAVDSHSLAVPNLFDRRRWWIQTLNAYRVPQTSAQVPAVIWNPLVALSNAASNVFAPERQTVFDLLDDWTIHFAFKSISAEIVSAYKRAFAKATYVTANSEATLDLARQFGRDDAHLILNGCDPTRFNTTSKAEGPITVGYVGKIGRRLDLDLIERTCTANPTLQFIFAGPILDREYAGPLSHVSNLKLLGDVHYSKVPKLLQHFDIGWVPHRVGDGEVGGDVIKTYEYRAAHLPVLTTPVLGADSRGLSAVYAVAAAEQAAWLSSYTAGRTRILRVPGQIPPDMTWESKARFLLELLETPKHISV